jgi:excisionase family DNA binding protein
LDLVVFPRQPEHEALLKPSEAARLFGVRPTTLARWVRAGRLSAMSTPGGHRRYRAWEIQAAIDGTPGDETDTSINNDDVVRLYDQGWSIREVAEKFGRDYSVIRRLLLERGVRLRARGGRYRP